jgi:hypothetical protein
MNRTLAALITALALGFPWAPLATDAEQAARMLRTGVLTLGYPRADLNQRQPWQLLQALDKLGRVEGQNIVFEQHFAEGQYERLRALAAELVQGKVEVIVMGSTAAGYALQDATSTIPIVLMGTADPVATGLATSLARPGHEITGVFSPYPELVGKWLELLKVAVPGVSPIAVLLNPANPTHRPGTPAVAPYASLVRGAAQALGNAPTGQGAGLRRARGGLLRDDRGARRRARGGVGSGLLGALHPECGVGAQAPLADDA